MNRNERNSQTKSVFWLVAKKIHKLGVSVQVYLGGTLGLRRGQTPWQTQKTSFKANLSLCELSDNFALPVALHS